MASSYFALKVFRKQRRARKVKNRGKCNEISINTATTEKCRICLKYGNIPIYENVNAVHIVEDIETFGDIQVSEDDGFPKFLCKTCYSHLQSAVIFRKTAKQSDELLRQRENIEAFDLKDTFEDFECESHHKQVKYDCKWCKISFETMQEFTEHKHSKQHKKIRVQCPICKRLLTVQLYERHLASHQSASHLICEVCGKMYRKDNLIRHLRLHSHELPYHCQMCPYKGRSGDSLKIHMRTHTGDKPYSCDKCQLRFLTRCNLSRHLLTHQKDRPYKCLECGRGFYSKRDVDVHYRSDHAGIKEFGCRLCGNKYGTKKGLMRHELRVHKREKMAKGRMPLYLQAEYLKENI